MRTSAILLLALASRSSSALVPLPCLLRVRGGLSSPHASRAELRGSAVQPPALLEDALQQTASAAAPVAAPNAMQVFVKVAKFLWQPDGRLRIFVVASVAALMLSKSLNVMVPFALKRFVDALEKSSTNAALVGTTTPLLIAYAGARLGVALANELRTVAFTRVSQAAQRGFSKELFGRLHKLDASFHAANPTGLLAVAFSRGVNGFRSLLFQLLFSVLPVFIELALTTALLAKKFSPSLAAVTLATFALYAAYTAAVVEMRTMLRKRLAKLDNARAAYLVDSLGGTEAIKLVGAEKAELDRFDCFLQEVARTMVRSTEFGALLNAGQALIFGSGLLTTMLIAVSGFRAGRLSIGDVVAVNGLLLQLARPMDFIGYTVSEIRQSLVDMDAMLRMLATPTTESDPDAQVGSGGATAVELEAGEAPTAPSVLPWTPPSVAFRGISYTYPNASAPALVDVSFEAPAGGTTCLVGRSGSGKSTTLRLLSKLVDADGGDVLLWGQPVGEMSHDALRARIGFVAQAPALFDDTLLWNVQLGDLDKDRAAIERAIEAASLAPCVAQLPHGASTRLGERGNRLSGGEKQRVGVARALLRDAPLLLADEPTSAADGVTEAALVEALRSGTGHGHEAEGGGGARTLLLVVHRLASVCPSADAIVVFRDGRVVEQGKHNELLASGGEYARLWRAQAAEAGVDVASGAATEV